MIACFLTENNGENDSNRENCEASTVYCETSGTFQPFYVGICLSILSYIRTIYEKINFFRPVYMIINAKVK